MAVRYVKCKHCGKIIKENEECIIDKCNTGIFCGVLCWALTYGHPVITRLTQSVLDNDGSVQFEAIHLDAKAMR